MLHSRFKFWLVVGLLTANLAVGVVSLYFLRAVNERYAVQFERSLPVINSLRTLSREVASVQRMARKIVDAESKTDGGDLFAQMDDLSDSVKAHALEISHRDLLKDTPHALALTAIAREYDDNADKLRVLARDRNLAEARRFHLETLRPCSDKYQHILDEAAADVEQRDQGSRNRYMNDSRFFGGLALAFAGWPVLVAAVAMVALSILVLVLLITVFTPGQSWRKSIPPTV